MKANDVWARVVRKLDHFVRGNTVVRPFLGGWVFQARWRTELALLEGKSLSTSTHPSIIHVGLNRSASQWIKSVLRRVCQTEGLVHVRWNEMAFDSRYPFLDHLDDLGEYERIFRPTGYLYSAYGGYPRGISEIEQYKVVLVVRDPRDILVSRYFSMAISHREPLPGSNKRDDFLSGREQAQTLTIDEYVLEESKKLRRTYDTYLDHLLRDHPDVHVSRYEDMTTEVGQWLEKLLTYLGISVPSKLKNEIIDEAHEVQSRDEEDVTAHVRKGKPGDYREKLEDSTITRLNNRFAHVLDQFDYRD